MNLIDRLIDNRQIDYCFFQQNIKHKNSLKIHPKYQWGFMRGNIGEASLPNIIKGQICLS